METTAETATFRYDNVMASARGIAETHGKKVVILVPATEIERITLKFGRPDHSPIFSMVVGGILTVAGVAGLVYLVLEPVLFRYELSMALFGAFGITMIVEALRRRFYLEIWRKGGNRRLVFSKKAKLQDIQELCEKLRTNYKWPVTEDVRPLS